MQTESPLPGLGALPDTEELFQTHSLEDIRRLVNTLHQQRAHESERLSECFGTLHYELLDIADSLRSATRAVELYKDTLGCLDTGAVAEYRSRVPRVVQQRIKHKQLRDQDDASSIFWQRVLGLAETALITEDYLLAARALYLASASPIPLNASLLEPVSDAVRGALETWFGRFDGFDLYTMLSCYLTFYRASPAELIANFIDNRARAIETAFKQGIKQGIAKADMAMFSLSHLYNTFLSLKLPRTSLLDQINQEHPEAGLADCSTSLDLNLNKIMLFPEECYVSQLSSAGQKQALQALGDRIVQILMDTTTRLLGSVPTDKLVDWLVDVAAKIRESSELSEINDGSLLARSLFPIFEEHLCGRAAIVIKGLDALSWPSLDHRAGGGSCSGTAFEVALELDLGDDITKLASKLSLISSRQVGGAEIGVKCCKQWSSGLSAKKAQLESLMRAADLGRLDCREQIEQLNTQLTEHINVQSAHAHSAAVHRVRQHFHSSKASFSVPALATVITICRELIAVGPEPENHPAVGDSSSLLAEMEDQLATMLVDKWQLEGIDSSLESIDNVGVYIVLGRLARSMNSVGPHYDWSEAAIALVHAKALEKLKSAPELAGKNEAIAAAAEILSRHDQNKLGHTSELVLRTDSVTEGAPENASDSTARGGLAAVSQAENIEHFRLLLAPLVLN